MKKYILLSLLFFSGMFFLALPVQAQITLSDNGNVAIKTASVDNERGLNIECSTADNCGSTGYSYGLYSVGAGSYNAHGIYGIGQNGYGGYGVRGHAENNNFNYGVRGSASGGTTAYGGYFTNGIYVSGGITQSSDERLKSNIRDLSSENYLEKISQLRPVRYEFLNADQLRQRRLPASHAEEGEYIGLLAQEVENIFPELVSDVAHIANENGNDIDGTEPEVVFTKAINYQGLTITLIAAMQEQQQKIEQLEARIEALEQ